MHLIEENRSKETHVDVCVHPSKQYKRKWTRLYCMGRCENCPNKYPWQTQIK